MLKYVAKFIELASFADDYVATDMAKVGKFEDGLKLSIRGKILRFLLQEYGISLARYGLYGQDIYGHRERD